MDDDIFSFLPNYFLTSPSGMRTLFGSTRMHKGADFGAPTGTPVTSPVAGKVLSKGFDTGGYGNFIIIEEPDGSTRRFSHLASMPTLEQGADVTPGMVIGEVGSTGRSTGPHLDYVMRDPDGGLNMPEVADESLYRAFGQAPRPRLDSTPRPIDPMREVRIGTGELGGADLRKGMSAGPVEFDRLGINYSPSQPSREVNTSEQPEGAKQLARLTQKAEGIIPMDKEGFRNVIRSDMMNNFSQYPAGILEEEGIYPGVGGSGGGLLGGGPVAQPKQERSFLERAIDFAGNVGAPLQQLGQGVALIEGDLQSAQALGQMVEGNRKREKMMAKERAAVKMLTDMGYSQDQAAGIVASGNVDTLLNAAVKQKFGVGTDNRTAKMKNIEYLVKVMGLTPEQALAMEFGTAGGSDVTELKATNFTAGGRIAIGIDKEGNTFAKDPVTNERLTQEQAQKIYEEYAAENLRQATEEEAAKRAGELRAKRVEFAVNTIDNLNSELRLLDKLESLYEREGEDFNPNSWVQRNLPTVSGAAAEFDQIMGEFGLGKVSSVTFGALSEGELNLAMRTAFPPGGSRGETLEYAKRKKNATIKLMNEMRKMVRFFENGGTQSEWLDKQEEIRESREKEEKEKAQGGGQGKPMRAEDYFNQ